MLKRLLRTHGMHTRDGPAEDFEVILILEVGGMPTLTWEHSKAEFKMLKHSAGRGSCCSYGHRVYNGQFGICQLLCEVVLLGDSRITPALGSIEFNNNKALIFQPCLIDPVFIAVERQQAAIGV